MFPAGLIVEDKELLGELVVLLDLLEDGAFEDLGLFLGAGTQSVILKQGQTE